MQRSKYKIGALNRYLRETYEEVAEKNMLKITTTAFLN